MKLVEVIRMRSRSDGTGGPVRRGGQSDLSLYAQALGKGDMSWASQHVDLRLPTSRTSRKFYVV